VTLFLSCSALGHRVSAPPSRCAARVSLASPQWHAAREVPRRCRPLRKSRPSCSGRQRTPLQRTSRREAEVGPHDERGGARTRSGSACRSPAVRGRGRCRMHGGAKGSGGPLGERNGRYTEGRFTRAAKQAAREHRRDVRAAAALVRRAVAVIEGREAETPALAAQWKAEGRAALRMFAEASVGPWGHQRAGLALARNGDSGHPFLGAARGPPAGRSPARTPEPSAWTTVIGNCGGPRRLRMIKPAEEFRRHALECRSMARDTSDRDSKATWNRLADRWVRCAELEEGRPAPQRRVPRYRQPDERRIYRHAS
jgi:hypothetical protein